MTGQDFQSQCLLACLLSSFLPFFLAITYKITKYPGKYIFVSTSDHFLTFDTLVWNTGSSVMNFSKLMNKSLVFKANCSEGLSFYLDNNQAQWGRVSVHLLYILNVILVFSPSHSISHVAVPFAYGTISLFSLTFKITS